METPPYIQSVISSKNISTKSAKIVLRKFLETQKKIFDEHGTPNTADQTEDTEDFFNMEVKDDTLGYEQFEERINALIESLSPDYYSKNYIKKKSTDAGSSTISIENVEPQRSSSAPQGDKSEDVQEAVGESGNSEEEEQGSNDSSSSSASKSISSNSKEETKLGKKEAKEANEAMKKEAKEAKEAMKKKAKEAKEAAKKKAKEAKEAMKKEAKEAKKAMKKEAKETKKAMKKEAKKATKEKEKNLKRERKEKRKRGIEDDVPSKRARI